MYILGLDIGGTKCAAILADVDGERITFLDKVKLSTDHTVRGEAMLERLMLEADRMLGGLAPDAIGVSYGSPLDSRAGIILSPPNLPGWDRVEVCRMLEEHYHAPAKLQNDANAGAVAEWKFGAGRGCDNMIFLTCGTGFGAGLILNGRLYAGANDNAGECGHIRIAESGPAGYGKMGSLEGFCSGGGIAQLGWTMALEQSQCGRCPAYYRRGMVPTDVTAKTIADAANDGDPTALAVYRVCGEQLGRGLAMMIDLLNPERIVIGSIFVRSRNLLWEAAEAVIDREALPQNARACTVMPAQLDEAIGDYAAIAAALI